MNAAAVYKLIRDQLGPSLHAAGYQSTRRGMLGWAKRAGLQFVVCWFQVSQDGWDPHAGSKFTLELQVGDAAEPGAGREIMRARVARFMSDGEREEAWRVQNAVIGALSVPPRSHWIFAQPDAVRRAYEAKFELVPAAYEHTDDVWFRYACAADVVRWAALLEPILVRVLEGLEEAASGA